MGRPVSIDSEQLLYALTTVFRDVGYQAASLTMLQDASGLKKASLYHRFPGGKEQMAQEVLASAAAWVDENILAMLYSGAEPRERIRNVVQKLDEFYNGGQDACLFNMLASPLGCQGPFSADIKAGFESLIKAFSQTIIDDGFSSATAIERAEKAVIGLQGSLVLARGMGTEKPFRNYLDTLEDELLKPEPSNHLSTTLDGK